MGSFMTISEALTMGAYLYPEKVAAKDLNRSMNYSELNERCCRLANGLMSLGLKKGDRFVAIAYNCVEWIEFYCAAAKAGLVAVPIMFRLIPSEYKFVLENSGAKAFIVGEEFAEGADSIRSELSEELRSNLIFLGKSKTPAGYHNYEELLAASSAEEPDIDVGLKDKWVIIYTSGTTGQPKGVVRTQESCLNHYLMHNSEMQFNRDDVGLLVMPMCHANSFLFSFNFIYNYASACVYSRQSFDPEEILQVFDAEKITFTSLVPTQYIMILSLPEPVKAKYNIDSIRNLLCSSAPVRRSTKREIMAFFKNAKFYEGYGSTESGVSILLRPEHQMIKLGSIGREVLGVGKVKLLNGKREEVPVGEVGEIFSKQPSSFTEYWNNPEKTKEAFIGEYFTVGDMAYKDEDGFFYLVDRKQNMIITGGENVYPSEVENVVTSHPAVKEICVIGVPDPKWGETIKAIVVLHDGFQESDPLKEDIIEFCRDKMAGYKRPRSVDFILFDDIPRTATGKVIYGSLRDKYGRWSDDRE